MACLEQLECISALLDGELSAEESTRLERHMATCPACKTAFERMSGLGSTLTLEAPPELPTDFTRKAAEFVLQNAFPQGPPPGPPVRPRKGLEGSHPILALVGARRRRPSLRAAEMLKVLAIFALPALAFSIFSDGLPLFNYIAVAGLGLMAAVPLYYFNNELSLIGSLIKGRCLEEVLGTSLEPTSTVDALARNSLRPILKALLPVAPVLLLAAFVLPTNVSSAETIRPMMLTGALLWLPVTLGLFLAVSYIALGWRIWARSTRLSVLGGLILAGATPLLFTGEAAVPAALLALGCLALLGRRLAILGLERPELVARFNQSAKKARRNRFLQLWSDNPITARELWRVSGSVPGGLGGLFAWRLTLLLMPLLWGFWAIQQKSFHHYSVAFWTGVAGFSFLLFLRAAHRTLGSVQLERQQQTWEPLLQTDLGAARFVRGWLEVAVHTVMLEGLVGALTLTLFAWFIPTMVTHTAMPSDGHRVALLVPLVLLFVTLVGALTGMALSASSRNSNEASQRLALCAALSLAGWLLCWGVVLLTSYLLALTSSSDTGSQYWNDFVNHDAPLASALAVALGLMLWSASVLRREVTRIESAPAARKGRSATYPLSVILLEISGVAIVSYFCLFLTVLLEARFETSNDDTIALTTFLGLCLVWFLWIRMPVATLAELARGTRWSLLLGAALGCLGGLSLQLVPGVLRYLSANNVIRENQTLLEYLPFFLPALLLGLTLLGAILGWLEARRAPSRRSLKKRLLVSGALGLLILSGAALWSTRWSATVKDAEAVSQIRGRTSERFRALKSVPAKENGLVMLPILAVPYNVDLDWLELGQFSRDYPEEKRLRVALTEPEGRSARRRFESVLPQLEAALAKPAFSFGQYLEIEEAPNLWQMVSIGESLTLLGLAEEQEGDLPTALEHYLLAMKWADRPCGQGGLAYEMAAVKMTGQVCERLRAFECSHKLSQEQYRAIIRQAEQTRFHPQGVADAMEAELVTALRVLERPGRRQGAWLPPAPASYMAYERASLTNYYLDALPGIRRARLPVYELPRQRAGILARKFIPTYSRALENYLGAMTRVEETRTLAALMLHYSDHGSFPADLEALVGRYLASSPTAWSDRDRKFEYRAHAWGFELNSDQHSFSYKLE